MAHYYVKKAFAHSLISPLINQNSSIINVLVISDYVSKTISNSIIVKVYTANDFNTKYEKTYDLKLLPFSSFSFNIELNAIQPYCNSSQYSNCLITFEYVSPTEELLDGNNFLLYNDFINQPADDPNSGNVQITSVTKIDNNNFSIKLSANRVSLYVWLDVNSNSILGHFLENGFHMTSNARNVNFYTINNDVTVDGLKQLLNVKSIKL